MSDSIECKTVFAELVEDLEFDKNGRYSTAMFASIVKSQFHRHLCFSYAIVLLCFVTECKPVPRNLLFIMKFLEANLWYGLTFILIYSLCCSPLTALEDLSESGDNEISKWNIMCCSFIIILKYDVYIFSFLQRTYLQGCDKKLNTVNVVEKVV